VALYKIKGHQIHCVEEGHPNRQVALLIHGWSSSWYAMSPLLGLVGQRFRAISVDLPGYISPITLLERFGLGSLIVSAVEQVMVGITDSLMRPVSFAERTGITEQDYMRLRADARQPGQGRARAECFLAMRENDLRGRLHQIETPSLVLWGAEDNTVPLRDAGVVADEWPEADLRIIPKAGHWPHFEAPGVTRRQIASFLGLPLFSSELNTPVGEEELARIREVARFLAHSDIGSGLNVAQRTRLAAQCRQRAYAPGENIVSADESGSELYIIQSGTVDIWSDPDYPGQTSEERHHVTTLRPGQMAGELAMLDQGLRSADLIAGLDGAIVLALERNRLLALCEDDAVLGTRLLWNIATAMSNRVRFILWQLDRASQRASAQAVSG